MFFSDIKKPPKPKVAGGHKQFLEGETFTIHCRVPNDGLINFKWKYPPEVTNVSLVQTKILWKYLSIMFLRIELKMWR